MADEGSGGTVEGVLGVWMAPTTLRMVLVAGENANGVTVARETIERTGASGPAARSRPDQVISAILGTREGAAESGYQLRSVGVTWTYPDEAAALRDALASRKIENVTLVSAFSAAAALAQEVGYATGYRRTALLFVEPHTATLAVVDTADGSVSDVRRRLLRSPDLAAELVAIVSGAQALHTRADGLFVVGLGVDVAPTKPALEAAASLEVSTPDEPETALARGGALASVHAPLVTSSTAALAYARDPGIGALGPYTAAPPGHFSVAAGAGDGEKALAYSAFADDEANASAAVASPLLIADQRKPDRRLLWVVASAVAALFVGGVVALVITLALINRPNVGTRFNPSRDPVVPTNPAAIDNPRPPGPPASSPAPAAPAPAFTTLVPAPPAAPPLPTYNPPWSPPGGDRHGGGHGEGGRHGGGGGHSEGEGHGGGGGTWGY